MHQAKKNEFALISKAIEKSEGLATPELKLKLADTLAQLVARGKKPFGLLIILGWQKRWDRFAAPADVSQDILRGHRIGSHVAPKRAKEIARTMAFDGAILIDGKGTVLHSGVMIEGLRPRETAMKLNPGKFSDLSVQFGFKEKVHTRHLTAITASYAFKGTTVFTVSEETGSIHIFENGRILYASPKRKK